MSPIRVFLAAATLLCSLATSSGAQAQSFFFFDDFAPRKGRRPPADVYQPPRRTKRVAAVPATADAPKTTPANVAGTKAPAGKQQSVSDARESASRPLFAVVSLEDQHVSIYGGNGLIERSNVSTGTESNPTPTGVFAIIQKERWHESNIYSGAPMPFMQRLTWSGVAMHQGQLPGYAASHGCVRLPGDFAEQWYRITKLGLRVLISPTDIAPAPIAHPRLPVPRTWAGAPVEREPVQSAALSNDAFAALAEPRVSELNPVTYATAEKAKAKADLKRSEQIEGEAGDAAEVATAAVKDAQAKLRSAERGLADARDRMAWFGMNGNRPPPLRADYGDGLMVAIANLEAANTKLSEAQQRDADARAAAAAAAYAVKLADERTEALKLRISEMNRRQETVSILISRKDGRLYVRQALRPVFDVPVTIRDRDTPIGNHVFVAAPPAPGERALRWTALSLPIEAQPPARLAHLKRGSQLETGSIGVAVPTESAAGALDRIELPGEVMDQLAELVWSGSSLIISDHGITHETGVGTDFIVQTRH
jgi:lipoprotein-anchoring transpeptidase ErfK/SrfK